MDNILNKTLPSILRTSTLRQSTLTFTATIINGVLGMVFYIFLARVLRPSNFGLFSLSVMVYALVADIGNLGINTGIVNFVPKYLISDNNKSLQFLKLGLISKIAISIITCVIGYICAPYIANNVFNKPELTNPLRLVFYGVGNTWLFSFTTSYYQATQKFFSWGAIQIFINLVRLIAVIYLASISKLNLNTAILCFIFATLLGFMTGFINISNNFLKTKISKEVIKEFFQYNKWVAVSGGVSAFSSRADVFILGRLASPFAIGLYSAANQLVQVIPQLIGAIGTVVSPKYASLDSDEKMLKYFKKVQLMVTGIAAALLISTPVVKWIIYTFFGEEYVRSYPIFFILLIAMLVFLISVPVHNAIIYYYSYPKLFSYLSIINLFVVLPSAFYLTSRYGVMATAYAVLIGNSVNFIIPTIWFIKRLKFKPVEGI